LNFQNEEYYHIYNRGVDRREIFCCDQDYVRFLIGMREFNRKNPIGSLHVLKESDSLAKESDSFSDKLVSIVCYCLIPNHYHFILKQNVDKGISKFIQKISTGYTNYFNFKYKRTGVLFQGKFKAIHITSESQLLRLSAYVNANAQVHKLAAAATYPWSSYPDYINKRNGTLCHKQIILDEFKNVFEYRNFTDIIIKEAQEIKKEINEI